MRRKILLTVLVLSPLWSEEAFAQLLPGTQENFDWGASIAGGLFGVWGNPVQGCSRLLGFIEGGFGALIAVSAGIGAIISSAVGGYRAAWSLLVVSVGSFILRSFLTLFHGGCRLE